MQKIVKATYGTSQNHVDIMHILTYLIINNATIRVSNDFFDDPEQGTRKRLFIQYDDDMCVFYDENVVMRVNLNDKYPLCV